MVLAAALGVSLVGCSNAEEGSAPLAQQSSFQVGPAALDSGSRPSSGELKFVLSAPGGAKPKRDAVVRVAAGEKIRYWIAKWRAPNGDQNFFCLYTGYPKAAGPTTNCFNSAQFNTGKSLAYTKTKAGTEFIGFLPDRWRAAIRAGGSERPLNVAAGVYVGRTQSRSAAIVISPPNAGAFRMPL